MNSRTESEHLWDAWNKTGGPAYPHEKVVQFCFRNYSPEVRKNIKALDLGCGNGVHTVFLAREGFRVTGIDISEVGISNASRKIQAEGLKAELKVLNADSINFPPDSYDLVICIGVLECIGPERSRESVSRIKKILKYGGRGLFLFAGESDFRVQGENPYKLYGFSEDEVTKIFNLGLSELFIDRYITTYQGGRIQQFDWLITIMK